MEEVSATSMFCDRTTYKARYCKPGYMKLSPDHDDTMMPSLSPQPILRQDLHAEQDVKTPFTMQSIMNSSSSSEVSFDQGAWQSMKHRVSKKLENSRASPLEVGCSSDVENGSFKLKPVDSGRLRHNEDSDGNSAMDGSGLNSDCIKSDIVRDDEVRSRTFSDSRRTPQFESRDSAHAEMIEGRYLTNFGVEEAVPRYRKYRKSPAKMSDMTERRKEFDMTFSSPSMKKFPGSASLDDNALAAMLQKYAVSSSNDGYGMSPLKTSGGLYPLNGIQEKCHFHHEMLRPPAVVSYGLPLMPGPGLDVGGSEKGSSHHDVFCCHLCSFMGTSEEDFQLHLASHYDYQCPHPNCTYSSRTEGRLKRHIRDFHNDAEAVIDTQMPGDGSPHAPKTNQPKRFKCRQCKFISYSREEHWTHNRTHIKEEKQLQCPRCPFVTEFKHHLEYHIRNHVGSKPFKCNKCNYSCVNKSMLNSHMKSHTNVYQFRCANCKYATKYSHSLKLHLLKKKHQPAVVLNPDGSLPTDGSGNFELVSKRGPPRGPRGPRKSKQPVDSTNPPALLPIFPASSTPNSTFSQGNDYSWVQAQSGNPPNGVAISTSLPPINVSLFPGAGTMSGQSLAYPLSMLSHLSNTVAPSLVGSFYHPERLPSATTNTTNTASLPFKCSFCRTCCQSIPHLAQHVKLEHADKLSTFGIKLEAKSPLQEPSSTDADRYHLLDMPLDIGNSTRDAVEHLLMMSHSKLGAGRIAKMNAGESSASKGNEDLSELVHLRSLKTVQKNPGQDEGNFPLDLSAKQNGDVQKKTGTKRNYDATEEDADSIHQCPTVSPSSAENSAAVSRKRSRKGKACKLDVISLKLLDRWVEEDCPVEEEESSFDSDCQQGLGSDSNNEMERPFSEVGCPTLSPPGKGWNDSNIWGLRKESPQPSDAVVSGDHCHGDIDKVKVVGNSDQEPVCDSLSNDSMGKTSESFTVHANMDKPVRKPADKGYYMCQHCEMGFRDCVTYTLHMGYHGYNDPFQCNMCGHRSEDPVGFFVHIARVAHE